MTYHILYDTNLECSIRTTSKQMADALTFSDKNVKYLVQIIGYDMRASNALTSKNYTSREYLKMKKGL